jgi:hypothetical protein
MADETFAEFKASWKLSDERIGKATKEHVDEAARSFALQSADHARRYGEFPLQSSEERVRVVAIRQQRGAGYSGR